ncbi:MAG: trehalose-6-phosphate synthase, partial [Candidatus Methylomirabilia bacterium]
MSLIVVSNREPYLHVEEQGQLRCVRPAGGLVTALDPVMRACGGTWVAHGAGPADWKVVDADGRVAVPPGSPSYTLKRVWLTEEEEQSYYAGFANEALWPLCHMAYVRPVFRGRDWRAYWAANQLFAKAVLEEITGPTAIWVQDYHLALLPAMVKASRAEVLLAHFWHIPWPSPDIYQICPWKRELLDGLLANDVLGFHIRNYCDNFLNTVARELEAKVDHERSAVTYRGHTTFVHSLPISVDFEELSAAAASREVEAEVERLRSQYGLSQELIAIGLDRIDYTKGIPERLQAVERFIETYPEYRRRFVFVQAGVRSRSQIPAYRLLRARIERMVRQINRRHAEEGWTPVLLLPEQPSQTQILALFRLATCLVVTPLDDGMNLVAKEFVAARSDGDGVLLLSQFTGAARELTDALHANPYDIEGLTEQLRAAVEMPEPVRRERMARLRQTVAQQNIYRWAGEALDALLRRPASGSA